MTGLITDPAFNLNRTEEYKLSIQVSQDGFSFSVIHENENKLLVLEYFPLSISSDKFLGRHFEEWIDNYVILQKKYNNYRITYHPDKFTFIPSDYYNKNNQEIPANIVLGKQNDKVVIDNYLPSANGNIIFPVSSNVREIVKTRFSEKLLLHPLTILETELHNMTNLKELSMVLYFENKKFDLILYKHSKPIIINSFYYLNADDVLYYVFTALKNIKAEPQKTTVYLAGKVFPKSPTYNNFKNYFKRVIFFVPDIQFNSALFKEPLHRFIVLF